MKKPLLVLKYLLVATLVMLLGAVLGQLTIMLGVKNGLGQTRSALLADPISAAWLQVALLVAPAVFSVAFMRLWIVSREATLPAIAALDHPGRAIEGALLGLAMWSVAVGFAVLAGDVGLPVGTTLVPSAIPLITFIGWTVQATSEEYVFRGWLLTRLQGNFRVAAAVLISAVIFSLTHGLNPDTTPIAYLNLGLAGVWLALMTLRTGGIIAASAAHTLWNWLEGSGTGLWSTGDDPQGGQLIDMAFLRPGVFGGPGGGMNDGIALSAAFALMILLELALRHRQSRHVTPAA